MSAVRPRPLLLAVAGCLAVAALAPNTTPALLWALLPAAGLLATALARRPAVASTGPARHVASGLAAALAALVLLTGVGAVATAQTQLEPIWVGAPTAVVGVIVVAGLVALGLAIAGTTGPRPAGILLAVAIPSGVGFDAAVAAVLPVGFFVHGVTIACLLLAIAVLRLARHEDG